MNERQPIAIVIGVLVLVGIIYAVHDDTPSHSDVHTPSSYTSPEPDSDSSSSGLTFHDYACTVDCSGHEAGYQWAEDNDITDEYDCGAILSRSLRVARRTSRSTKVRTTTAILAIPMMMMIKPSIQMTGIT